MTPNAFIRARQSALPLRVALSLALGVLAFPQAAQAQACSPTQGDSTCSNRAGAYSGPEGNGALNNVQGVRTNAKTCPTCGAVPPNPNTLTNTCLALPNIGAVTTDLVATYVFTVPAGGGLLGTGTYDSPNGACGSSLANSPGCAPWVPAAYPYLLVGPGFMKCDSVAGVTSSTGSLRCNSSGLTGYAKPNPNSVYLLEPAFMIACQNTNSQLQIKVGNTPLPWYVPCSDCSFTVYDPAADEGSKGL